MHARRAPLAAAAVLLMIATGVLGGCASEADNEAQFNAARVRAATALLKVEPSLDAGAAETVASTTVESTSTPRATLSLADLVSLDEGRGGWRAIVRVEVEDDGGLFGGSSTLERCYAYDRELGLDPGLQVPHQQVDCP